MNREIHDIYDVILKIIVIVYGEVFLNFIGIDKKIRKILKTEFVTVNGTKYFLDFLCLFDDGTLGHIEFQFPKARPIDLDRFFDYNIVAQVRHGSLAETIVINFTSRSVQEKIRRIGESKCFNPKYVYLGDIDFDEYWRNINIKVKSNLKLTGFEEIALLLTCLIPECNNKANMLEKIYKLLKNKELFDKTKFEYIQVIIQLEIENLISKDEQERIIGGREMTPQVEKIISQAIIESNRKSLHEAKLDGIEEGREEVARNLKGIIDDVEISRCTGLTVERIRQL